MVALFLLEPTIGHFSLNFLNIFWLTKLRTTAESLCLLLLPLQMSVRAKIDLTAAGAHCAVGSVWLVEYLSSFITQWTSGSS